MYCIWSGKYVFIANKNKSPKIHWHFIDMECLTMIYSSWYQFSLNSLISLPKWNRKLSLALIDCMCYQWKLSLCNKSNLLWDNDSLKSIWNVHIKYRRVDFNIMFLHNPSNSIVSVQRLVHTRFVIMNKIFR